MIVNTELERSNILAKWASDRPIRLFGDEVRGSRITTIRHKNQPRSPMGCGMAWTTLQWKALPR